VRVAAGSGPDGAWDTPPAPELLRNLLFYVAKSPGGSPRLDAAEAKRYQLKALLTKMDSRQFRPPARVLRRPRS